ncbi:MAG TPA: hypothetical protein VE503_12870 [Ornithinibacter sp.]|nr:hypothetical protein [Ornithinibacter sp.]
MTSPSFIAAAVVSSRMTVPRLQRRWAAYSRWLMPSRWRSARSASPISALRSRDARAATSSAANVGHIKGFHCI